MDTIMKIVAIIVGIILILLLALYSRGMLGRGFDIAQNILGESSKTASQTIENINSDILLSTTKFSITIKKAEDETIIDSTTLVGYSTAQSYLQEYNVDITELRNDEGTGDPLTPDTIIKLYDNKCKKKEVDNIFELEDYDEYKVKVIVSLPSCETK